MDSTLENHFKAQGRHPSVTGVLRYFEFDHLPAHLQAASSRFHDVAFNLVDTLPDSPELTVALRKLLESKDAAVRCAVDVARS